MKQGKGGRGYERRRGRREKSYLIYFKMFWEMNPCLNFILRKNTDSY